ncbi:MAG: DUF2798 domain-containing protein [Psychrobium sp.]
MMNLKQRLLTSLFMSFFMASIMSGTIISHQLGINHAEFWLSWRNAFLFAWPIAFPTAFCVQPLVKNLVTWVAPE